MRDVPQARALARRHAAAALLAARPAPAAGRAATPGGGGFAFRCFSAAAALVLGEKYSDPLKIIWKIIGEIIFGTGWPIFLPIFLPISTLGESTPGGFGFCRCV